MLPTLKYFRSGQPSRKILDPTLYAFPEEAMDNLIGLVDEKLNKSLQGRSKTDVSYSNCNMVYLFL